MLNLRKHVYEVDENGFFVEMYLANVDEEGNILDEDKQGFVTVDYPSGLWKRKWTGTEWVEGESQSEKEERETQQLLESLNPSEQELSKAERELETIDLLLEMGLI